MSDYRPRHARSYPDPATLPPALRGLADLITEISNEEEK